MDTENMREQAAERFIREQKLQSIRESLSEVHDKLGEPIDAGITEALIGLNAHEVTTTQSCEGHDDRANALPWVDIGAPEPEGWKDNPEITAAWTAQNQVIAEKTNRLLTDWKTARQQEGLADDEAHAFELHERGIYGAVRLEPAAQEVITALDEIGRQGQSGSYRQAMNEFAEYLQQRYLEQE